jgi:hypothetical protein
VPVEVQGGAYPILALAVQTGIAGLRPTLVGSTTTGPTTSLPTDSWSALGSGARLGPSYLPLGRAPSFPITPDPPWTGSPDRHPGRCLTSSG